VEVGRRVNGRVEVRRGLAAGERVVLRPSPELRDGQAVRPKSAP